MPRPLTRMQDLSLSGVAMLAQTGPLTWDLDWVGGFN